MSDTQQHAPGWHPDPWGRHQLRWWDGRGWTEHVSSAGQQGSDAPGPRGAYDVDARLRGGSAQPPRNPVGDQSAGQVQRQVQRRVDGGGVQGGGTIFTEPILVVNQKAKLIEVSNEYAVYDQHGRQIAAVRQIGQSAARKVLRVLSDFDQFLKHQLEIVDASGQVQLRLTRPGKVFKSTIIVTDGHDRELGRILQQNVFGKIRFGLESGGHAYGSINAENWRAWNFRIEDHAGAEVARITKTFAGFVRAAFTTADNYVVQFHRPLDEPLRSLVVASALSVDTALKQDQQGFN